MPSEKPAIKIRASLEQIEAWKAAAEKTGSSFNGWAVEALDVMAEADETVVAPAPVITTPRVVPEPIKTPTKRQEKPSQAYLDALAGKVSIKKT